MDPYNRLTVTYTLLKYSKIMYLFSDSESGTASGLDLGILTIWDHCQGKFEW